MKYYNKDYANFVVSDEKEKRIETDKVRMKREIEESSQKKLANNGVWFTLLWAIMFVIYLIGAVYTYLKGSRDPGLLIVYVLMCISAGASAILYYFSVKKAREDVAKKAGAAGT